jgi:HSP20 family molecular chaperone IbpA
MTTRPLQLNGPFLLGFEEMEKLLERVAKTADGYPPYNIERLKAVANETAGETDAYRITLAVAGFAEENLSITLENRELIIRGRQDDDSQRLYLHRGIAARQFQRRFLLADGVEVTGAQLANGLLTLELVRKLPPRRMQTIPIGVSGGEAPGNPKKVAVRQESSGSGGTTPRAGN